HRDSAVCEVVSHRQSVDSGLLSGTNLTRERGCTIPALPHAVRAVLARVHGSAVAEQLAGHLDVTLSNRAFDSEIEILHPTAGQAQQMPMPAVDPPQAGALRASCHRIDELPIAPSLGGDVRALFGFDARRDIAESIGIEPCSLARGTCRGSVEHAAHAIDV